jgi:hypothetical protein
MGEGLGGGDAAKFGGDRLMDVLETCSDGMLLYILICRSRNITPSLSSPIEGEGSMERHHVSSNVHRNGTWVAGRGLDKCV